MRYRVTHSTRYDYAEPVSLSHNIVRLRPRSNDTQTCLRHEMLISPAPNKTNAGLDYFANHWDYFSIEESHTRLAIQSESEVEVNPPSADPVSLDEISWEQARQMLVEPANLETLLAREFSFDSSYVARSADLASYSLPSFPPGAPLLQSALGLTQRIHQEFEFLPGSTRVGTPILEILQNRRGVCQDFAHFQIGCLRSMGLAARYVSGYLATTPPPGEERLTGADVSHAWVGVYSPRHGWVDFDPTNGIIPSMGHITVAWARDYDDLGPIRGVLVGGRRQKLNVSVDVEPILTP